ncbi:MAG: hypothetical protein JNG88_08665 [Phycisphaerales bacterium]|nr:hypothetical protein [Phycisphaerales bacterium]
MRRRGCAIRGKLAHTALLIGLCTLPGGQTSQPVATRSVASSLAALAQIEDFRFDFDQPGFYDTVAFVQRNSGVRDGAIELAGWRDLLERPRDFRGQRVIIRGVVGTNRAWMLQQRPELGTLHQIELYREGEPLAVTLICTGAVADVPLGAEIEATGVFVMIRNYHSGTNQIRPAALIVSPGPTLISTAAAPPRREGAGALTWLLATAGGALAAVWMLYRANSRATRTRIDTLRARRPAEQSVAEEFRAWADADERTSG